MRKRASRRAKSVERRFSEWLAQCHNPEMIHHAEILPLRRDMVALLTYVRDNKVIGTKSTGNMPLKSVREVTARFVNPPELEHTIGEHTYHLRSEADLWPLYFLHILAEVGGLLTTAPARRWRLVPTGEGFLGIDPLLQVLSLLTIWWYEVNWLVAYPIAGMGEKLPLSLGQATLTRLRSIPTATDISFEEFADELIVETGLTWTAPDMRAAPILLRSSIERMVIRVLADFGAVECKYRDVPFGKGTIPKLVSFEITPFGKALLEAIEIFSG